MPNNLLPSLIDEGRALEKRHDWVAALEPYGKALATALERDDFSKAAEISELMGFSNYRAAMQAGNPREFRSRMSQATDAYSRAAKLAGKLEGTESLAEKCHYEAKAAYTSSWLEPDICSRKRLLDRCWKLEKKALGHHKKLGDRFKLGKTCNELCMCQVDRLDLEWNKRKRKQMLEEALTYGETAIATLSDVGGQTELWRAYCTTSTHYYFGALGLELEKRRQYERKSLDYSEKAVELSEKIGDSFHIGLSSIWSGSTVMDFTDNLDLAANHFKKALQCGITTRDNYLIGRASYLLAHLTAWKMVAEEDPEKIREGSKKCEKYSRDAIHHYTSISNDQEIASGYYWLAENYIILARSTEATSKKKRAILKKSIMAGRKGLDHARRSGSIHATWFILHTLSKSLFRMSTMEMETEVKKRLLDEALHHRQENIEALGQALPYYFWNSGVYYNYLALIQAELAEIESDENWKKVFLGDAVKSAESCVNLCLKHGKLTRGENAVLGGYYSDFGRTLNRFHLLTEDSGTLRKSKEAFKCAVERYGKADLPSRVAESFWRLAKTQNKLQNYVDSAEGFEAASNSYRNAAKGLPRLKDFYSEYATYMQAWSEIERARYAHAREDYGHATKHYKKAADLHESTSAWRYLAPNYSAWVQLEQGEDSSRKEQSRRAITAFKKAAEQFGKVKQALVEEITKIQGTDEKEMAIELNKASDLRQKYCIGRIAVEEAKILDRQGDHTLSSKKYGSAAETFGEVAVAMEHEWARKELKPIIYLCLAWQKMTLAEAKASSSMYLEAAELFEKAKEYSLNEKAMMLALGHSHFCKGLEAGIRFEDTLDAVSHSNATRHLESAANYYVRAGFRTASEYAKASKRLFSAYMYVDKAQAETDPMKKTQHYRMAGKLLQASADSYLRAKHPEKSEVVGRLLKSIKEEQQLATSLAEVLHAPTATSTTSSFITPNPNCEEAVGLEKFEHAHVQSNLIIRDEELDIGEGTTLCIEIANAGNGPATLVRVEGIVPAAGFEVTETPEMYRVKGDCLDLRGKRLDPLGTEDVKISVKPLIKGVFLVKPRIIYTDETSRYKFHEPEPATITVKELGIKGWIKGRR